MSTSYAISVVGIALLAWDRAHAAEYEKEEINPARISLATAWASSVNGGRAMDNPYYGTLNAFNDGVGYTNWASTTVPGSPVPKESGWKSSSRRPYESRA